MSAAHYIDIPSLLSEEGGGFIVGVSGGIDSITLADMLYRQGLTHFALAHCNFHLRGEESDGDAVFVQEWAAERGIKFLRADFDTAGYAARRGVSIEMAARELRYGYFALLCRSLGYSAVAIAHNANDNAETLLLNLVRGTGLRGICGMQTLSSQTICSSETLCDALGCSREELLDASLQIWRPLLGMTRKQIEGYALAHNLRWREDRTNADSEYKRNLIRNEVMPLLERLNPSVVKTLCRDMAHFSDAAAVLDSRLVFGNDISESAPSSVNMAPAIRKMVAQRSEGWKYALYTFLEKFNFNPAVIAQVEDLIESSRTRSGKIFLSPTHRLTMTGDSFVLESLSNSEAAESQIVVSAPGEYAAGGGKVKVEIFDRPKDFLLKQPEGVTVLDADKVAFPFVLRSWKDGDWMRPLGCRGRKKLSDLFTDLKFSLPQKRAALLLSVGDSHVLSLLGLRVDESVKICPDTTRILRISYGLQSNLDDK